jgi:hypothetical protein
MGTDKKYELIARARDTSWNLGHVQMYILKFTFKLSKKLPFGVGLLGIISEI